MGNSGSEPTSDILIVSVSGLRGIVGGSLTPEVAVRYVAAFAATLPPGPIVIGRDHLDCGSVASPNRETEAMKDGTDAVADWPILNAMINAVNGASWVSLHHGGGVGIGYSIHSGQVIVADGTDAAAKRIQRVLTSDPAMGVLRHADAGYDEATTCAKERGVRIPGLTT